MTELTAIILTKNEELHIARAIASVRAIATQILVVDSGSTDQTVALAQQAGARVLQNPWRNYASQFNWGLDQIGGASGWVLRLDADEIVTPELAAQIQNGLAKISDAVDGVHVGRRMCFQGCPIRFGGLFPTAMLRLFRNGRGRCEDRWMDEHIIVTGGTVAWSGCIIDDNRKPLDWWIDKHNGYASREVVDILNCQYRFLPQVGRDRLNDGQAGAKRWVKDHIYGRLPGGLRAGLYFLYRYIARLGFLDGPQGRSFHVLQGFWYRYLVDAKLSEVRAHMKTTGASPPDAIRTVLGIAVEADIQRKVAA
ncbi:glycosyltransferase family 2 protein [Yoonia sediminilitoris]|uniref:Glycosyltransferase involved in cell wall biosynthesis n=1 Tax=Yoonia sediminilitoris TaxID=1286148 RepID=A0A2T6KBD7_9RHOB|nr:glycosyltransferase family 2 protein [Yoonia sediminilitoris]PUB12131.1 glycosyltransferase involved in cell wall biosynthesis [Yoonia sediminilitoris]RCW92958.1 glycosyltransferase involved in cell wall biosynthesis [Yoonia sediminilitoris]